MVTFVVLNGVDLGKGFAVGTRSRKGAAVYGDGNVLIGDVGRNCHRRAGNGSAAAVSLYLVFARCGYRRVGDGKAACAHLYAGKTADFAAANRRGAVLRRRKYRRAVSRRHIGVFELYHRIGVGAVGDDTVRVAGYFGVRCLQGDLFAVSVAVICGIQSAKEHARRACRHFAVCERCRCAGSNVGAVAGHYAVGGKLNAVVAHGVVYGDALQHQSEAVAHFQCVSLRALVFVRRPTHNGTVFEGDRLGILIQTHVARPQSAKGGKGVTAKVNGDGFVYRHAGGLDVLVKRYGFAVLRRIYCVGKLGKAVCDAVTYYAHCNVRYRHYLVPFDVAGNGKGYGVSFFIYVYIEEAFCTLLEYAARNVDGRVGNVKRAVVVAARAFKVERTGSRFEVCVVAALCKRYGARVFKGA